jgi:uncharacterized lipoprotein YddW (UPF0748 family)
MKRFLPLCLVIYFVSTQQLFPQFNVTGYDGGPPKHEFRAAWVATAIQLDWPKTTDPALGELSLRNIIRRSKEMGMNAIVFQVSARGDAMYQSERLPWAPWLTGVPGQDPGWDPLAVAIDESRMLGMELHAWYNVSLVGSDHTAKSADSDPPHVVYAHPEWVVRETTNHWINPGIPDVRQWQVENVIELVENYDIDAIHFDYIRYPSGGFPGMVDWNTWADYNPEGFTALSDWRRHNITTFVRDVHAEVKSRKPWVKIGSAVMGHYSQWPGAWSAFWGYENAYQESRLWLEEDIHDYVAPMIYWGIGQEDDTPMFEFLVNDWASAHYGKHVFVGTAPYKANVRDELPAQIDTVRAAGLHGQVHFRYDFVNESVPPFGNRYDYLSLVPRMEWLGGEAPPPPTAVRYERIPSTGTAMFTWEDGSESGETMRFVLYQFPQSNVTEEDLNDPRNIIYFTGETSFITTTPKREGNYFAVTALDRNSNESLLSTILELSPPDSPLLAFPADQAGDQRDTVQFIWEYPGQTGGFHLQVGTDPQFAEGLLVNETGMTDTTFMLTGMGGQQEYYWRVKAFNPAGESDYSETFSFRTGFPVKPLLVSPAAGTSNVPLDETFTWNITEAAETYHFQLAWSRVFQPEALIVDTVGVSDTTLALADLDPNQIHFWRVGAVNEYGRSAWSDAWGFRTTTATYIADRTGVPEEYSLRQNYPNPFNPETMIQFSVPEYGRVAIRVYDVLGREVAVLVDENIEAGIHQVRFNAHGLPSGMYIYRITAGSYSESKRMMYLK